VNLDNVRRDDWIVGGLAILLIITLFAFPWFSISAGPFTFDFTGTDAPDGWLGVLAVIALIAVVADLALERLSPQTQVPAINNSRTMTRFVLVVAAAGFMALKFLFHLGHVGDLGWGFWLGAILAAALVYVAMQARAGGEISFARPGRPASATPSTPPASAPPASTTAVGSSEPPPSSPPPGA
jgi:hypothetical protein